MFIKQKKPFFIISTTRLNNQTTSKPEFSDDFYSSSGNRTVCPE